MRLKALQGHFKRLCEDKYADQRQFNFGVRSSLTLIHTSVNTTGVFY